MMEEDLFNLLEYTRRHVFLTGKAGTGKTTFLNSFVDKTNKKYIVVAPTGIAAINAGGVTIHSMFGLPLRTFFPTSERIDQSLGNNIQDLHSHFRYRKDKLKLLREVEMIIIDEVSMLRADVLDMVDLALRHIRRNPEPFGGVQMLFIGDLYQLPPVVRDEQQLLQYYKTPFFFSAHALAKLDVLTIELMKVYRQQDPVFIDILNAIRDGNVDAVDFDLLNAQYSKQLPKDSDHVIYLTSHNAQADTINLKKLQDLPGNAKKFEASIYGDFRENLYPVAEHLELKVGAQVMFIRNDTSGEKKFYNGMLATVSAMSDEEIWIEPVNGAERFKLKKEIWENKNYLLDAENNIQEDVLGSFEQFPVRLAWAVTIHKSQGLTFDKVVIDAGKAFASGQVYVALSRCRSLEGITLTAPITPNVVFADQRIQDFHQKTLANTRLADIIERERYQFACEKVLTKLDPVWLVRGLEDLWKAAVQSKKIDQKEANLTFGQCQDLLAAIQTTYQKFQNYLRKRSAYFSQHPEEWQQSKLKIEGAVDFFLEKVSSGVFQQLKSYYTTVKGVSGLKAFNEAFRTYLEEVIAYLTGLQHLTLLGEPVHNAEKIEYNLSVEKIPTHVQTYRLFAEGLTINEIGVRRGLKNSTIYGHLAIFADAGLLDRAELERIIDREKIEVYAEAHPSVSHLNLTDAKAKLSAEFEYYEVRILQNYFNAETRKQDE